MNSGRHSTGVTAKSLNKSKQRKISGPEMRVLHHCPHISMGQSVCTQSAFLFAAPKVIVTASDLPDEG